MHASYSVMRSWHWSLSALTMGGQGSQRGVSGALRLQQSMEYGEIGSPGQCAMNMGTMLVQDSGKGGAIVHQLRMEEPLVRGLAMTQRSVMLMEAMVSGPLGVPVTSGWVLLSDSVSAILLTNNMEALTAQGTKRKLKIVQSMEIGENGRNGVSVRGLVQPLEREQRKGIVTILRHRMREPPVQIAIVQPNYVMHLHESLIHAAHHLVAPMLSAQIDTEQCLVPVLLTTSETPM